MSKAKRITIITKNFEHFGKHSGYDLVFTNANNIAQVYKCKQKTPFFLSKALSIVLRKLSYNNLFDLKSLETEIRAYMKGAFKAEIVHFAYLEWSFIFYCFLRRKNWVPKRYVIVTIHHPPAWWRNGRETFLRAIMAHIDLVIALNHNQVSYLKSLGFNNIKLIPHPIDTDFYKPNGPEWLNLSKDKFTIVVVGNWLRDHDLLLRIIEKINSKHFDKFEFKLRTSFSPQLSKVSSQIHLMLLRYTNVSFLDKLTPTELASLYQHADFLLLPLIDTSANNALLESLSCGTPVICTKVGIDNNLYINPSVGLEVQPDEIGKIVDYLLLMYSNRAAYKQQRIVARNWVEEYFTIEKCANETVKIYENCLL